MFWDGKRLITEKRFGRLAIVGLFIAGIGVAATVVQAWAAVAFFALADPLNFVRFYIGALGRLLVAAVSCVIGSAAW
ncbi:hypothetical protein [Mesorhizobium sp. M0138]|uniref:hypothetical protein n=1 Tax=Mesorhizobium sp. M0138 TaxID=2956891 RepID=UPI0033383AAC